MITRLEYRSDPAFMTLTRPCIAYGRGYAGILTPGHGHWGGA